jgi:CO/xanthine dehydrogenase FAD-binding subunit
MALAILAEEKEKAYVVAGGTNVLPNIRSGKITAGTLVDIGGIRSLRGVELCGDMITVGALTTIGDLEKSQALKENAPVLWQVAKRFADPSTRHSATVGGNICNASAAADCAPALLALDARLILERQGAMREVSITDFFKDKGQTILEAGELLTRITFKTAIHSAFYKLCARNAMSISAANFAVALEADGQKAKNVRIATGCLGPYPMRAKHTEALLEGQEMSDAVLEQVAKTLNQRDINPHSGLRATEAYRRMVAPVIICRLLKEAFYATGGTR